MRISTVRAFALGMMVSSALNVGAVLVAGTARADGHLDSVEADYAQAYGAGAICPVIDGYGIRGVMGALRGIVADGFAPDSAVDVINAAVSDWCPRNWPLLVEIGEQARADLRGTVA